MLGCRVASRCRQGTCCCSVYRQPAALACLARESPGRGAIRPPALPLDSTTCCLARRKHRRAALAGLCRGRGGGRMLGLYRTLAAGRCHGHVMASSNHDAKQHHFLSLSCVAVREA